MRTPKAATAPRMLRDRAAGLIRVNSAFIPMIGRLCMSSRAIAR